MKLTVLYSRKILLGFNLLFVLLMMACEREKESCDDYRQAMREFVVRISETAREQDGDFIVIPQNGIELVTTGEGAEAPLSASYLAAIDGHGQEDLYYGYSADNEPYDVARVAYSAALHYIDALPRGILSL